MNLRAHDQVASVGGPLQGVELIGNKVGDRAGRSRGTTRARSSHLDTHRIGSNPRPATQSVKFGETHIRASCPSFRSSSASAIAGCTSPRVPTDEISTRIFFSVLLRRDKRYRAISVVPSIRSIAPRLAQRRQRAEKEPECVMGTIRQHKKLSVHGHARTADESEAGPPSQ